MDDAFIKLWLHIIRTLVHRGLHFWFNRLRGLLLIMRAFRATLKDSQNCFKTPATTLPKKKLIQSHHIKALTAILRKSEKSVVRLLQQDQPWEAMKDTIEWGLTRSNITTELFNFTLISKRIFLHAVLPDWVPAQLGFF